MKINFSIATYDYNHDGFNIQRGFYVFRDDNTNEVVGVSSGWTNENTLFVYQKVGENWVGDWEYEDESMFPVSTVISVENYLCDEIDLRETIHETDGYDENELAYGEEYRDTDAYGTKMNTYTRTDYKGVYYQSGPSGECYTVLTKKDIENWMD